METVNHDYLNENAISIILEDYENKNWTRGGNLQVAEDILSVHGSYVIDEDSKTFAQLDPANHAQFLDGTPWDGVKGNSFRWLPRIYYLVETLDTGLQKLWLSLKPISQNYWEERFIGTYKGSYVDGVLRSIPGVHTQNSQTMSQFDAAAKKNSENYGLVNYFDFQVYNALALVLFGDANSDHHMGTGLISGSNYTALTGATASLGDGTGSVAHPEGGSQCKLFGIEALAGQSWEFRPNIRFTSTECIIYDGNIVSNTAEGRHIPRLNTSLGGNYISKMHLGEHFDLVPEVGNASAVTWWCDGGWSVPGGQLLLVGGASSGGSICGLACSASYYAFSYSYANIGARLAFRGPISAYAEVSGANF